MTLNVVSLLAAAAVLLACVSGSQGVPHATVHALCECPRLAAWPSCSAWKGLCRTFVTTSPHSTPVPCSAAQA